VEYWTVRSPRVWAVPRNERALLNIGFELFRDLEEEFDQVNDSDTTIAYTG